MQDIIGVVQLANGSPKIVDKMHKRNVEIMNGIAKMKKAFLLLAV